MYVFGSEMESRGCFFAIPLSLRFGKGARLQLPVGGQMPGANVDQYLAVGIQAVQKEKYYLLQCFNEATYTYAFGHDPAQSTASITFVGFMISQDGTKVSDVLNTFNQKYGAARLSRSKALATITVGSNKISGFIVGTETGTADPHHNLQTFTIYLLLISPQGGGGQGNDTSTIGGAADVNAPLTNFAGQPVSSNQLAGPGGGALNIGSNLAQSVANTGGNYAHSPKPAATAGVSTPGVSYVTLND